MRAKRALLLLGLSASWMPFACTSSSDTSPPTAGGDGGDFDGAPLDGPGADGPGDGGGPDAPPGTATVTVLANGAPEAGIFVVFQDASGVIVETKPTGADGKATRAVTAGGMITVVLGGPGERDLLTFVGVTNGDDLVAIDSAVSTEAPATASIELPTGAPAAAVDYQAYVGPCSQTGAASPLDVTLYSYCTKNGKFPSLVNARDNAATAVAYTFKKDGAAGPDGGQIAVAGMPAWITTFGSYSIAAVNVPSGSPYVDAVNSEIADDVPLTTRNAFQPTAGAGTTTLRFHPGYADAIEPQVIAFATTPTPATSSQQFLAKRIAPPPSATALSFDMADLLPAITDATIDLKETAHPVVSWTSAAALTAADGGILSVRWQVAQEAGGSEGHSWTFILPPTATSVRAPSLPPSANLWLPDAAALMSIEAIAFVESDLLPSYDALRAGYLVFARADYLGLTGGFVAPVLPGNGVLRGSFLAQAQL